jgi:hypothetical protein
MTDNFTPKNADCFFCEKCDFKCCKPSDWIRHTTTRKHKDTYKILTNNNEFYAENANVINTYICDCGKEYKHRQSLWNHKKKCENNIESLNKTDYTNLTPNIVLQILKQNEDLQKLLVEQTTKLMELAKDGKNIINSNNINNTTNNFNLNVFLNEKCKDAINITDFVNSLVVTINDLEETTRLGYAEGISKIFVNGLKQLDIYKRPIHCSDLKREVLYIKDQDNWEKDEDKTHLLQAIKVVGHKNIKQISEWQKMNPQFNNPESKQNDKYLTMLCNVMSGGSNEETSKNYNKIVKNIIKETVIDK